MKSAPRLALATAMCGIAFVLMAPYASAAPSGPSTTAATQNGLSGEQKQQAEAHGIDIHRATVENKGGLTMITDSRSWVVYPTTPSATSGTVQALSFSAGACWGSFFMPIRVNSTLEWGGQDSCASTNSPNDIYPHYIKVKLRQGNTDWASLGRMFDKYTNISTDSRYSTVATVHVSEGCGNTTVHNFDVVVWVYVRGIEFGPYVSDVVQQACGV